MLNIPQAYSTILLTDSSLIDLNQYTQIIHQHPWIDNIISSTTDWPTPNSEDYISGLTQGTSPAHHPQQYAGTVNKYTTQYIICSTLQSTQSTLKGHLCQEDYKPPDHQLAALIIRKSTFLPYIITPLLQEDPYTYQQQYG